jgi:hypothetical protein
MTTFDGFESRARDLERPGLARVARPPRLVSGTTPFVGAVARLLGDQGYDHARSAPRTSALRTPTSDR